MPIVSSTYLLDTASQKEETKFVIERHVLDTGEVILSSPYLIPEGFNMDARISAQATSINTQLAEQEASKLLGN